LAHILIGEPVSTPDQVRGRLSPEYALAAVTHSPRRSAKLIAVDCQLMDHASADDGAERNPQKQER